MTLIALLQARDEERFLTGWLENVAPSVDAIVALDDGSRDATAVMLAAHPKTLEVISNPAGKPWNERANHMALIEAGRRHGATWFLCVDADERLEQSFAGQAAALLADADRKGLDAYSLQVRELWNDRAHYRVDGVWGGKARYRLFRNDPRHTKFDPRPLHRYWMPFEILGNLEKTGVHLPYNIYHLRMIRREDREARFRRYAALDPGNRYQSQGYGYLVDEVGMELVRIPPERDFLPSDDPAVTR